MPVSAQHRSGQPAGAAAAIAALDALLDERERQVTLTGMALGRVQEAHDAVRDAESAVRRAEGPGAVADAIVMLEAARAGLTAAATEAAPAKLALEDLDARLSPGWAAVREATFTTLDAAEGEAARQFNEAIARARHAAARINLVRSALGNRRFDMPRVSDPANPGFAAGEDVELPLIEVPHAREVARLRTEFETARGR